VKERPQLHLAFSALLFAFSATVSAAPSWEASLTKDPPGNFSELRPVHTTYHFGWSGITAGKGEMQFSRTAGKRFQLEANGGTTGFARALWKLDATYHGTANADTLRPIESKQVEAYRRKKITTELTFTDSSVSRIRTETPGPKDTKPKSFVFPGLFDLHSAMLYLRSQPLSDHSVYRVVVYPATSAYMATITVLGREHVSVHAGSYNAIKLDIQLKRLGKDLELEPHRKFRRATVWISDDENRVPLRIEAQIFVGTVFAELYAIHFDQDKN
jgi:Protein of unknown function (DUF3108)